VPVCAVLARAEVRVDVPGGSLPPLFAGVDVRALNKIFCLFAAVAFVAACSSSDTTNGVPAPTDPSTQNPGGTYTPPADPSQDPRLPGLLSKAVALRLTNPTDYSGLEDLAKVLYLPLVGDPKIAIEFSGDSRDTTFNAKILVAFEDQEGFWGAVLDTFPKTGVRDSSTINAVFADDELAILTLIAKSGDNIHGEAYYRLRASGDTACRKNRIRYQYTYYPYSYYYVDEDADVAASNCRSYMQPGQSQVKLLGTFDAKYSNWVVR
jgi:hypothetical protein